MEEYKNEIIQEVKEAVIHASENQPKNLIEIGYEYRLTYLKLRTALRLILNNLTKASALYITNELIEKIRNATSQTQQEIINFKADPKGNIDDLDHHITELFYINKLINNPQRNEHTISINEIAIDTLLKDAEKFVATLEDLESKSDDVEYNLDDLNNKINEIERDISNQKSRIDQIISQQTESFSRSEQQRSESFSTRQEQRTEQFSDKVAEWDDKLKNHVEKSEASLNEIANESKNKSKDMIEEINSQLLRAEKVVGTIVNTSMSGTYKVIAQREYTNAWIMRGATILCFAIMGGIIIWAANSIHIGSNGVDLKTFIVRISFGFLFLAPALYCARESSLHWEAEKSNRKIALELATLDPFLNSVDEDDKKSIISEKSNIYFSGQSNQSNGEQKPNIGESTIKGDQLLKILENFAKILNK